VKPNQAAKVLTAPASDRAGPYLQSAAFRALKRLALDEAFAGDIVSLAGFPEATSRTPSARPKVETPLAAQPIDPPTLA